MGIVPSADNVVTDQGFCAATAMTQIQSRRIAPLLHPTRNMLNHPVVRKVYVFAPNFAREFRYNERALVYSGLLAARADFTAEVPLLWAFRWSKDRP